MAGCSQRNAEKGHLRKRTFDDAVSVKVDDAVIQACHEYIAKRDFESSKKSVAVIDSITGIACNAAIPVQGNNATIH